MRPVQTITQKINLLLGRKEQVRKAKPPIRGKPSTTRGITDAVILKSKNIFFLIRRDGNVPFEENHGFGLNYPGGNLDIINL